jgi:hypothetical protein
LVDNICFALLLFILRVCLSLRRQSQH